MTWAAIFLLLAVTAFIAFYPLGQSERVTGGIGKIPEFDRMRVYVLAVSVPASIVALGGAAMSLCPKTSGKARFWAGVVIEVLLGYTVLRDFFIFTPIWPIHGFPFPNPSGLAIATICGLGTWSLSEAFERVTGDSPAGRRFARRIAAVAVALPLAMVLVMAPYFRIEWLEAPAVLNDNYELAWHTTIPASNVHIGNGFWFPSQVRQRPKSLSSAGETILRRPPLGEDALFLADGWLGRIRLTDGAMVWGRDFDFGPLEDRTNALAAYWSEDHLYVVNRSARWTIFAYDWDSGELLWTTETKHLVDPRPDDPELTLAVTPKFLIIAGGWGKAEYYTVDHQTGRLTTHMLPAPDGTTIAQVKDRGAYGFLGPYLVQGTDDSISLLAYFAPGDAGVDEYLPDGQTAPETSHLFGIDSVTGRVSWQVADVGGWRGYNRKEGQNLWIAGDIVVKCSIEPGYVNAWDTSTGQLLWGQSLGSPSRSLATHYGVIVHRNRDTLECLDTRTGTPLWSIPMEVKGELPVLSLEGQTLLASTPEWVAGLDVTTGSSVFRIDAPADGDVMLGEAMDGVIRIRVEQMRGRGPEKSVFYDLKTGAEVATDPMIMSPTPSTSNSYLFAVRAGVLPDSRALNGIVPVFKTQGQVSSPSQGWETGPVSGYLGQFTEEGCVLLTSIEYESGTFHVYMLRPTLD